MACNQECIFFTLNIYQSTFIWLYEQVLDINQFHDLGFLENILWATLIFFINTSIEIHKKRKVYCNYLHISWIVWKFLEFIVVITLRRLLFLANFLTFLCTPYSWSSLLRPFSKKNETKFCYIVRELWWKVVESKLL